ncbi:MAG: Calx-beta domain-containing protein [Desulfurivibrio sp.]|nr:Calx-beta domain-containing protein [Desulfurivibrio sp.]
MVQQPEARSTNLPARKDVPREVNEGEGVWFLVELGAPAAKETSVDFRTRDGSAKAGYDYISSKGTITLEIDDQWVKVWVQTLADDIMEADETFSLVLENPRGATFPGGVDELVAERTIKNDISLLGVTNLEGEIYDVAV